MIETIKIFLASSSELKEDRDEFRKFLGILNDRGHKRGVYFELIQWEYFLDSISHEGKQADYNEELKNCQILVCLFYTKAGKYSQEEFDTALQQFKETGSPLIFAYFKSGAPEPAPTDEQSLELNTFKKRLSELKHFYTVYDNIDGLKNQFSHQLELLEDKGLFVYREDVKRQTDQDITNYFQSINSIIDSDNNIIIQGVSANSITVNVNGQTKEIEKKLDALQSLIETLSVKSVQSAKNVYKPESITEANFDFLVGQAGQNKYLPAELAGALIGEGNTWIQSLKRELQEKQKVAVGNQPWNIFQNFGWLVETFLQKMGTAVGQEKTLRRLSFMTEAYQASLRYLCYIQVAQLLKQDEKCALPIVADFIHMTGAKYLAFDYTSLLLIATQEIGENGFVREIWKFKQELTDTSAALYGTALYLGSQRQKLLANDIAENEELPALLDEYLTALVYWLRKVSFLAKYRLVSVKEINLSYRLGSTKNFVHLYGELHGLYTDGGFAENDYNTFSIENFFTYNKSVLLFKGTDVASSLDGMHDSEAYLSLSPLIIDQSVYAGKPTQTPEIFYYTGYEKIDREYNFALYKNELARGEKDTGSNKYLNVLTQNNKQPQLDELFEQLEHVSKKFKTNLL